MQWDEGNPTGLYAQQLQNTRFQQVDHQDSSINHVLWASPTWTWPKYVFCNRNRVTVYVRRRADCPARPHGGSGQESPDRRAPHPAHLNFDDASPRSTASAPLALPFPSHWRAAPTSFTSRKCWLVDKSHAHKKKKITPVLIPITVRTSSQRRRVNGLRGSEEPWLPRWWIRCQANLVHAVEGVIN